MSRRVLLLLFLANLFLLFPLFLPNLSEINPWDEANYVNKGRELVDLGEWSNYAGNPLVSVLYALTYLPFRSSPYWLIHSDSLARVLLFSLLWWSAVLVAGRLKQPAAPAITAGLLLVTPLAAGMLTFPSDPLFAGLAALSLWQLLGYIDEPKPRHLALSSLFLGLAALARNDGLVLFPVFLLLALLLSLRARNWRSLGIAALAAILPFALLVGGYVLFYGLRTGDYNLGTLERTYLNFEAGQQVLTSPGGELNEVVESRNLAEQYFGSAEENGHSVLRAIQRNPGMYLERLSALLRSIPERLLRAYGIRFGAPLILLALRGAWELLHRKQYWLLAVLLLWPAHLLSGFAITLFRAGHLQFAYYIVFGLAALGLAALLERLLASAPRQLPDEWPWLAALLAVGAWAAVDDKLAVYYGVALFAGALLIIYLLRSALDKQTNGLAVALLVILAGGLVLHGDYPSPERRVLGSEPREQAVLFLAETFAEGSTVAASSPGPVWMAKMQVANLTSPDVPLDRTPEAFVDWLRSQGIQAVFVDQTLSSGSPGLWALLDAQVGTGLERVFSADEGDIQVLLVK
jgi:hypothetical protein